MPPSFLPPSLPDVVSPPSLLLFVVANAKALAGIPALLGVINRLQFGVPSPPPAPALLSASQRWVIRSESAPH